jgi:hypothetical protein
LGELQNFFQLLDADSIGVRLSDSGMMLPLKSYAGFYLIVDDPGQLSAQDCAPCSKNLIGCQFCKVSRARQAGNMPANIFNGAY